MYISTRHGQAAENPSHCIDFDVSWGLDCVSGVSRRHDDCHGQALYPSVPLAFRSGLDGRNGCNDVPGHIACHPAIRQTCQEQQHNSGSRRWQGTQLGQNDSVRRLLPCSVGSDRPCASAQLVTLAKQCSRGHRTFKCHLRLDTYSRRRISVQPAQGKVPRILRITRELFHEKVEERNCWRGNYGNVPRAILPRVLLAVFSADGGAWVDEHSMDGTLCRDNLWRKDVVAWNMGSKGGRDRACNCRRDNCARHMRYFRPWCHAGTFRRSDVS